MSDAEKSEKTSGFAQALPALTLMFLAPLIAEVLPGATRISSIFVFPIEVLIWGSGAVLIRYFVRRYALGWFNMLLLALALAVAEEWLIQQTSVAPLIIKLKGVEYARAFGINYVYFPWALLYEAIFVVLIPVGLTELIFPKRRETPWLNAWGVGILSVLFVPACFLAWFSWTQMARTQVFHLPPYDLPLDYAIAAAVCVLGLIVLALGPTRRMLATPAKPLTPPHPFVLCVLAAAVSCVIFGLDILAFGIKPDFPPLVAVATAVALGLGLLVVPRFMADGKWSRWHDIGMLYGAILGNFAIMFVAFIGAAPIDLYGKIVLDLIATVLLIWLMLARGRQKV